MGRKDGGEKWKTKKTFIRRITSWSVHFRFYQLNFTPTDETWNQTVYTSCILATLYDIGPRYYVEIGGPAKFI